MNTTSPKVANETPHISIRSSTRNLGQAVWRAASIAAWRVMPGRWLIDLPALALAGLLVAAGGLYGLAVGSARVATPNPPTADRFMGGEPEAGAGTFGVWDDVLCCYETR